MRNRARIAHSSASRSIRRAATAAAIDVRGDAGGATVRGLAARVRILHSEAANDRLEINTLVGTDAVDSGGLAAGAIQLIVDGAPVP